MSEIKQEAKIITHLSEKEVGEDIHLVKELTDKDGEQTFDIKIIKDFERPFWVTKEYYRNHKDKKEAEEISKVDRFKSTESRLYKNVSRRLGERYIGITDPRIFKSSPYLYGTDVDSRTILKYMYNKRNNNYTTKYRIGSFDIEVNVLENKIIIISLVTYEQAIVVLLKSFLKGIPNPIEKIKTYYEKYIPDVPFKKKVGENLDIRVFNNEIDMIKYIFKKANYVDIDFLTGWNIKYDITEILERLDKYNINHASIFHYDKIPFKYRYFKFKEGRTVKVTESGKEVPLSPEEQWHTVKSTTNYYFIDNMSSHRYIRVGGATVPGGYGLDNILRVEGVNTKLRFDSDVKFKNIEWHIYMVKNKPIEYIIYNIWDNMGILEYNRKTNDLPISLPLLSGVSHFDIFNSGPKKLVDAIFFFYLTKGYVLGVKDPLEKPDKLLGLDNWIITLNAYLMANNGIKCIAEDPNMRTNFRTSVWDLDIESAYPNATRAANVSKDTTHREIVTIKDIEKALFKAQNINMMYGKTNAIEYCMKMFNLPGPFELIEKLYKT